LGLGVPGDVDATFRIGVEGLDALAPVDGHSAPPRDETDDVVARQWIATLGVAHQYIVDTGHRDAAALAPAHAIDDALDGPRLELRPRRAVGGGLIVANRLHQIFGRELSVTDGQEQLIDVAHVMRLADAL